MKQRILDFGKKHSTIVSNFSYLSLIQIVNLIIPLVTYPYIIRVVGADKFGLIVYSQAIIGYFAILVNFGFNITATKEVSYYRNNKKKLSQIVSSVFQLKLILFLIAVLVLILSFLLFTEITNNILLYTLTMWLCLNEFIFPIWYFQGIEMMRYITILSLISKVVVLIFTFLLVREENDYLYVPALNVLGVVIVGIYSYFIIKRHGIKLRIQPKLRLIYFLRKSYIMAIANASNTIKSNFNLIAIKIFFSYSIVAYYDLAFRVVNIIISFSDIYNQSIFPRMSLNKDKQFLKSSAKVLGIISIVLLIVFQFTAGDIVLILGGSNMSPAVMILRILLLYAPFYAFGTLYGRNVLIVYGYDKIVMRSMIYSSFLYLIGFGVMMFFKNRIPLYSVAVLFVLSFVYETYYRYKKCAEFNLLY